MERLTAADDAFLRLEDRVSAMHGITLAIFDGGEPDYDELLTRLGERVHLVPRLRQRVIDVPLGLERPLWIDDPQFSLDYHLRHTAVPSDRGIQDLSGLIGRLLSQRLDRGKPLWELWMIGGLGGGRWAVASKAHHAMVDGVSGSDPLSLLVDQTRVGSGMPPAWMPEEPPTEAGLLATAATELVFDPAHQMRLARRMFYKPAKRTYDVVMGSSAAPNPKGLVGAVGAHRRWLPVSIDAAEVRAARDRLSVSTNDVLLGLCSAGFRRMLSGQPRALPSSLRTLVPLAIATGERFTNEITALEADLPVGEPDIDEVIRSIGAQSVQRSGRNKPVAGKTLSSLRGLYAPTLSTLGLRSATRDGLRLGDVETVVVNAPGPNDTISLLDRPLVALYPAIPLVAKVRISVGVMSYRGEFHFGITGDHDADLELGELAAGLTEAVDALSARAS